MQRVCCTLTAMPVPDAAAKRPAASPRSLHSAVAGTMEAMCACSLTLQCTQLVAACRDHWARLCPGHYGAAAGRIRGSTDLLMT